MKFAPTIFLSRASRFSRAMTLVEIMVAVAIGSLVLAVVGTLSMYSGRNFASMGNYVDLDIASRKARG